MGRGPISGQCLYRGVVLRAGCQRQTWSGNWEQKTYSDMLASNTLVATFLLCLLVSFTEISQGSENKTKSENTGMFNWLELLRMIDLCLEMK